MDEPRAENVPSGLRFSSTMPGGHESSDVTLARKPGVDYSDVQRFSTSRVIGAGGYVAWEGRLEAAPRVSGDQMAISPSAVGYQAHLDDDKSASIIYLDAAIDRWTGASSGRRLALIAAHFNPMDPVTQPNQTTGAPTLEEGFDDNPWTTSGEPIVEALYDAGAGNRIGRLLAAWAKGGNVDSANVNWHWDAILSSDDLLTTIDATANLRGTGPGSVDLSASGGRRFASLRHFLATSNVGASGKRFAIYWTLIRVLGDHGLTLRNSTGLLASDIVAHAVGRWAPLLNFTLGETITSSSFVIPHLAFYDPTTASEIINQATRFGLQDWAVWDDKTFYWAPRGTFGRKWRARIAPAQLSETGASADQLWESIVVQYQDVDGSTRTVGPPGSGVDTEDATLKDVDPENPANQLGIVRRALLQMGISTAAGAIEVGRRFLEEQKALNTSGQAQLVGHVTDDRGVAHPAWRVRAGDQISFVDAADSSYRRVVRADYGDDARTCTIDLDAPPEGLQALLERLGVVLAPLGIG